MTPLHKHHNGKSAAYGAYRAARRFEALERRELLSAVGLDHGVFDMHVHGRPRHDDAQFVADPLPPVDGGKLGKRFIGPVITAAVGQTAAVPAYHSLPGAAVTLYLDFDGHFEPVWGAWNNVTTPPYDTDGNQTTFNATELAYIASIWARVAEDFAPFNLDVTTEEPPVLAAGVPIQDANGVALRVAMGGSWEDWYGSPAGGLGYINSFTDSIANVVFVFTGGGGLPDPRWAGRVASHEAGHGFGLHHQSLYDANGVLLQEYHPGDSTWVPIMGNGQYASDPTTTWHNGPTPAGSTNFQDDMAVLAGATNGFGYRADDHTDTPGAATPLSFDGVSHSGSGIIETNLDVDSWSFTVTADGTYRVAVDPAAIDPNLDAVLELRDAAGALLATAGAAESLGASVVEFFPAGTYYVSVTKSAAYGWVGSYTVSVTQPTGGITVTATEPLVTAESGSTATFQIVLHTSRPTADVTIPISSSDVTEATVSVGSVVFTPQNWNVAQTVTVTGVNDGVADGDAVYTIVIGPAASADGEYDGIDVADLTGQNIASSPAGFVYWTDWESDLIQRAALDGAGVQTLVDLKAIFGGPGTQYEPRGVALDIQAGTMYWTDAAAGRIQRANLDGSNVETVLTSLGGGLRGVALDVAAGKMYWASFGSQKIQRANLDGSGVEDLVVGSLSGVRDISLDLTARKMYWIDLNENNIRRANLDGSNVEVLWTGIDPTNPGALTLDVPAGKMYWSDITKDKIYRADLSGANVEEIVDMLTVNESTIAGLAIDPRSGKLYWTDNKTNAVHRANLDGSGQAVVVTQLVEPHGVALLFPAISVNPKSGLITTESGAPATFQVSLTTPPAADVVIPLSTSDATEGTVSPASLTFTAANWNVPQVVTVTGVDDTVHDGNVAYTIVTGAATSADFDYQGMNAADVSVTNADNDPPPVQLYFALQSSATLSGISVANEDIVAFDGSAFSLLFDGSDVGLASLQIDAFSLLSPMQIVLSFTAAASIPGVSGTVDDSDLVLFTATSLGSTTAGSFSWYFDGSDVGLTTNDEDVDAVELLDDGSLLISTLGSFSVPGASGTDADLIRFVPTSLGATTNGTWSMYFDASDVGLSTSSEDVDAVARDAAGKLYFSTTGNFSVNGVSGADEDVFTFHPGTLGSNTTGTFSSALFFDGSAWGLSGNDITAISFAVAPAKLSQARGVPPTGHALQRRAVATDRGDLSSRATDEVVRYLTMRGFQGNGLFEGPNSAGIALIFGRKSIDPRRLMADAVDHVFGLQGASNDNVSLKTGGKSSYFHGYLASALKTEFANTQDIVGVVGAPPEPLVGDEIFQ